VRSFNDASRVLGDLEQDVMELLWEVAPLAVREVQCRVAGGKLAYTTVMTTLDRLYKKGLLGRDKVGLAFVYRPAIERHEYQRRIVEAAVAPLLEHGARAVLAAFVDVASENEDHLRQLEELIAARRKQQR
jgi:predicted transcriptional regulator